MSRRIRVNVEKRPIKRDKNKNIIGYTGKPVTDEQGYMVHPREAKKTND